MKTIHLIRHAKSDWTLAEYLADSDRGLALRGYREAPLLGEYLGLNPRPGLDVLWCSTAVRAYATAKLWLEAQNLPLERLLELRPDLYEASPCSLEQAIRFLPESVTRLWLLGHNPLWDSILQGLDPHFDSLPTCGFAHLEYVLGPWSEFAWDRTVFQAWGRVPKTN